MGFHETPYAGASMVLNLVDTLIKMSSDFQLFKNKTLNVGFCDKKRLVTRQRMRKFRQSPTAFFDTKATTNH